MEHAGWEVSRWAGRSWGDKNGASGLGREQVGKKQQVEDEKRAGGEWEESRWKIRTEQVG